MRGSPSIAAPDIAAAAGRERVSHRTLVLVAVGSGLTALYAAATVRLALPRYFPGPGRTLGFTEMLGADWRRIAVQYVVFVLLAFALYGVALAAAWRCGRSVPPAILFGFPAVFVLVLAWMYPAAAMDVIKYQADARTFWVYGDNPLTVPPAAHPYPIGISWADAPSPYGPLWTLLTFGPAALPGDHYLVGLLLFKLLAGAFFLGCAWLLYRLVARVRPGWESTAVVLFAWSPFVALRAVGNGHNDLVMMFFVLAALERAQRRDWLLMFPALAASVLVKYATALLVPMFLWYAWSHAPGTVRERARALAPGLGAAVLLTVLCFVPFWEGAGTLAATVKHASSEEYMITSTPLLIKTRLDRVMGPDEATGAARRIAWLAFLALYVPLVWQARRDFTRLVTCSFNALFLYLLVASVWFRPWYMLWPLTLAALLPGTWFTPLLLATSFSCAFPDLVEHYRYHWHWLRDYWRATAAPVVVAFIPPLLVWYLGLVKFESWHFDVRRRTRNTRGGEASRPDAGESLEPGGEGRASYLAVREQGPRALALNPSTPLMRLNEDARERQAGLLVLALALVGGAALRVWLAFNDDGIYWPDEIYQSIEPAHRLAFGYGLRSWEFVAGARNWTFPGLIAVLLKLSTLVHLEEPRQYVTVTKLAFSTIGVATAYGSYRLARAHQASTLSAACAAALFALLAPAIYFGPRALSETASALPIVLGYAFALHPQARRWEQLLGASLLGLAVLIRLQNGVFCLALLGIFAGRRQWRPAAESLGVLLAWAFLFGLVDKLTWGGWFHSARVYLQFGLLEGKVDHWGTDPFHYYLRVLWTSMGTAPAVLVAALSLCAVRRAPGLLMATLAFFLLHSYTAHKELRYILPALPLFCALAGIGIDSLPPLVAAARKNVDNLAHFAAAAVVLSALVSAAGFRSLTFGDLGQYEDDPPGASLYFKPGASAYDDSGPVNRLLLAAYKQQDLCGLKIESVSLTWTGGYSYLHRPVPLYPAWGPPPEFRLFNYVITFASPDAPGEIVAADGNQVLVRLGQDGCIPDVDYDQMVFQIEPRKRHMALSLDY